MNKVAGDGGVIRKIIALLDLKFIHTKLLAESKATDTSYNLFSLVGTGPSFPAP